MSLLILGSLGIDEIETSQESSGAIAGGSALYASWGASYFADAICMCSIMGDDFIQHEIEGLQNRGVSWNDVQKIAGQKTFRWSGRYHEDMNIRDTIKTELNVLENFSPTLSGDSLNADIVMLANLSPVVQLQTLSQLSSTPKLVGLDTMNFWMDNMMGDVRRVIQQVDILFLNDSEALQLSGEKNLRKAIRHIQGMGPKYVCVKKGEHGAILAYADEVFMCPAFLLEEVYDPTGAGDTFAGGMMGYLAQSVDVHSFAVLQRAIMMGTVAASYCVERFGTAGLRERSIEDMQARFHSLHNMIQLQT